MVLRHKGARLQDASGVPGGNRNPAEVPIAGGSGVVLDTNMLLAIGQLKVDVFADIKMLLPRARIFVPVQVKEELGVVGKRGKRNERNVRIARIAIRKGRIKEKSIKAGNADEALVKLAAKGFVVATNDSALKREIKKVNGRVIFLRQKKHLTLV